MQLKQLQFFVVSVDMGSFKAAADVLYTSQPHISKTIKALEEELNMSLLNRQATGVVMTEEGRKVYEYANSILRNVEMISNLQEETRMEKFSVSANPSYKLTKIYAGFTRKRRHFRSGSGIWKGLLRRSCRTSISTGRRLVLFLYQNGSILLFRKCLGTGGWNSGC